MAMRSLIASSIRQFHPPKLWFLALVCPEVDVIPIVLRSQIGSQIDPSSFSGAPGWEPAVTVDACCEPPW
ncbi:hypothetical protein F2Q68_00017577 [Brassica cretica]|uniref:Uncharacterized protein n=1 Tax=Brassica cretica TaxID=69181 RepID=A0A8S9HG22_BRACR|nr:hypothetical protein F2Q68_00017577 [Brassica cretica]